jgi:hypothetical protein
MKVPGLCELLPDESAADHLTVHRHKGSAGLIRKDQPCDGRHNSRVDEAGDDDENEGEENGGAKLISYHGMGVR